MGADCNQARWVGRGVWLVVCSKINRERDVVGYRGGEIKLLDGVGIGGH